MDRPSGRPRGRVGVKILFGVAIAVTLSAAILLGRSVFSLTGLLPFNQDTGSLYYRFTASYLHKEEIVDFNIVVGCAITVTEYGGGGTSWDAFRFPSNFVKATSDGGAVWQHVPDACQGETVENGKVPADFMPGAIWFDDKDDLSFGIGYFLEDAFENPRSQLTFLGSSIQRATREEFEQARPDLADNLIDPKPFTVVGAAPTTEEIQQHMWDKRWLTHRYVGSFACYGVERYRYTNEVDRQTLREYWPEGRPRFWMPDTPTLADAMTTKKKILRSDDEFDGRPYKSYWKFQESHKGFPTRKNGGVLRYEGYPPEVYPVVQSDAIPWIEPPLLDPKTPITRQVDMAGSGNKGLLYCYLAMSLRVSLHSTYVPGYETRRFIHLVDQEEIQLGVPNVLSVYPATIFFERDEFFYRNFNFTLN
jgi:hypothetical protein